MLASFFSVGFIVLLSAMLPGPDFALVTKNTLLRSRRAGIYTALGIAASVITHVTYCLFGVAILIKETPLIFTFIKYSGSVYLIFLGMQTFLSESTINSQDGAPPLDERKAARHSHLTAFKQGYFCNLLNPKASLFVLALFTVILKHDTPLALLIAYSIEMVLIIFLWFILLTFLLSRAGVIRLLQRIEKYISKLLGIFLILFGIALAIW